MNDRTAPRSQRPSQPPLFEAPPPLPTLLVVGIVTIGLAFVLGAIAVVKLDGASLRPRVTVAIALTVAVATGGAAMVAVARLFRRLKRQLSALVSQAERLSRGAIGEEDAAEVTGMQVVASSFRRVEARMTQLTEARSHVVATEHDLDRARRLYRAILPLSSTASHGSVRIAGHCTPAAEAGGDWWAYRKLSDDRVLIVVGDATGHGVYSAMIGCAARGAVETLVLLGEEHLTPREVLSAIHSAIRIPGSDAVGMTCFAALIDSKKGTLEYGNAGHIFPFLASMDDKRVITNVSSLTGPSQSLGDDDAEVAIHEATHQLGAGDILVAFTDGVVDRGDGSGRVFGPRRLQIALTGAIVDRENGLVAVRDRVVQRIEEFGGGAPLDDDVTLVLCMYDPPPGAAAT
mgnify:CR=1 FL=1